MVFTRFAGHQVLSRISQKVMDEFLWNFERGDKQYWGYSYVVLPIKLYISCGKVFMNVGSATLETVAYAARTCEIKLK